MIHTGENKEEILILGVKNNFFIQTGKHIKIVTCTNLESKANFTPQATVGQIIKMVFDSTKWTWRQTYSESREVHRGGDRSAEKIYRRGLIDYICINNGCTLVSCAIFTNRDHTTVINSIRRFEERLETESYTKRAFEEIVNFCRENFYLYKDRNYTKEEIIEGEGENH